MPTPDYFVAKKIYLEGIELTYYLRKEGRYSVPPILMLHGLGGDSRGLMPIAKELKADVYLVDLPGFGSSEELKKHDIKSYTSVLASFLSTIPGRPIVFGHSFGSAIALALVASEKDKVSGLILLSPVARIRKAMRVLLEFMYGLSGLVGEKLGYKLLHSKLFDLTTFFLHQRRFSWGYLRSYVRLQQATKHSLRAWRESSHAVNSCDQYALAQSMPLPSLVLVGNRDSMMSVASAKTFARDFPNAKLSVLSSTGHFAHAEVPHDVARSIDSFADDLSRP